MKGYRKILIAVNGSKDALAQGLKLAQDEKCWVTVVKVIPENEGDLDLTGIRNIGDAINSGAASEINRIKETADKERVMVKTRLEEGKVCEKIVEVAEEENCDLIVMGSERKSWLSRIFGEKIIEKVIDLAPALFWLSGPSKEDVKEKKMKRNQLLFVTYHDENFEDGLSYALDLAKTMNDGIEILMIYKRKVLEKFDDMMTAITFAEAGEHQTAREMISEDYKKKNEDYEMKLSTIKEKCTKSGISVDFSTAAMDAISAIKNILRQNSKIDMVLLSPSVTNDGNVNAKVLNKLVKTASRPVVTMAKQASVA